MLPGNVPQVLGGAGVAPAEPPAALCCCVCTLVSRPRHLRSRRSPFSIRAGSAERRRFKECALEHPGKAVRHCSQRLRGHCLGLSCWLGWFHACSCRVICIVSRHSLGCIFRRRLLSRARCRRRVRHCRFRCRCLCRQRRCCCHLACRCSLFRLRHPWLAVPQCVLLRWLAVCFLQPRREPLLQLPLPAGPARPAAEPVQR